MKILIVCWMLAATAIVSGCMQTTGNQTGQMGEADGGGDGGY